MDYFINQERPFFYCDHHLDRAPRGFAVTVKDMDKACSRYAEHQAAETEKQEKIQRMTMGDAYIIFSDIDDPGIEDEVKGMAIWKIINLETHNGVTKDMMLKVIRYLMGLAFDLPEEKP